jgi:hypothetical protein
MKFDAIKELYPSMVTLRGDTAYDEDGNEISYDADAVQTKVDELQADYDAKEYQRKRAREYPSWQKQLEKIYDDGVDAWKTEMVDPIKAKYPKPGE